MSLLGRGLSSLSLPRTVILLLTLGILWASWEVLPQFSGRASGAAAAEYEAFRPMLDGNRTAEPPERPRLIKTQHGFERLLGHPEPSHGVAQETTSIEALKKRLDELLIRFTEKHPDVQALRRRIADLERRASPSAAQSGHKAEPAPATRPRPQPRFEALPMLPPRVKEGAGDLAHRQGTNQSFGIETFYSEAGLRLPITVTDVSGVGASQYPINVVVPLPRGRYQEATGFRLIDANGSTVPAQFNVLNRWWGRDGSIRHLEVVVPASVGPTLEGEPQAGTSTYYLLDSGAGPAIESPLRVDAEGDTITVNTGKIRFAVNKRAFHIVEEVMFDKNGDGLFGDEELLIPASNTTGSVLIGRDLNTEQWSHQRNDVSVSVEEAGPLRAVILAQAPTRFSATGDPVHGFAVRIYAYAGEPYLKIDYQLQNSDKRSTHAGPLYFDAFKLSLPVSMKGEPVVRIGTGDGRLFRRERGPGLTLAQERHDQFRIRRADSQPMAQGRMADGFLDISNRTGGVCAFVRYFWEMWPNGLAVTGDNTLEIQLFPAFSAQLEKKGVSQSGLYWLSDMQHVYKETLLAFHDGSTSDSELIRLAGNFRRPPVATLPSAWYGKTRASLDLGGVIPLMDARRDRRRRFEYEKYDFKYGGKYRFNWSNFYLTDISRKWNPAQAGGWPDTSAYYMMSESPRDVERAELVGLGELNVRPHWLAGYRYDDDFERIGLGWNLPWQPLTWRKGGRDPGKYLPGTRQQARPRDDAHSWYYHVRQSYIATANPWIRDWFRFMGEYRKTRLAKKVGGASREIGHSLASAIDAFRVTGDEEILRLAHAYVNERLREDQDSKFGFRNSACCGKISESAFQVGYLSRAVIDLMEEVGPASQTYADAFQFLSGLMAWNLHFAHFGKRLNSRKGDIGASDGTSFTLIDPQAWYYWHTGKREYWDQIEDYMDGGIRGGDGPFGSQRFDRWTGGFAARWYRYVKERPRDDALPPARIEDLSAVKAENGTTLRFTAPPGAVRYHIVWGDEPITEETSTDEGVINWWAAHATPAPATSDPQGTESIELPAIAPYVAVFSFDAADNMSRMSNLARLGD